MIAVIGAGLVGCLAAMYSAKFLPQYTVCVFEKRTEKELFNNDNLKLASHDIGRSVNLALSHRGLEALSRLGLKDTVLSDAIPIKGRMMHLNTHVQEELLYGNGPSEVIYSVQRWKLQQILLDAAKTLSIDVYFEHEVCDFKNERLFFTNGLILKPLFIFACDGVNSKMRGFCLKDSQVSQKKSSITYQEYQISKRLSRHHLHVWPIERSSLLMALPNHGSKTFTGTLFAPESESQTLNRFDLVDLGCVGPVCPIKSVECKQFCGNVTASSTPCVLLGDSAHAMVPFYGQGVNCGFEDVRVLFETLIGHHQSDWLGLFQRYSDTRVNDCHVISSMAEANFMRMLGRVRPSKIDSFLSGIDLVPSEYRLVSFSSMPYSQIASYRLRRKLAIMWAFLLPFVLALLLIIVRRTK